MNFEDINFPVYRKYKNNASYFKILNPVLFEEIQVIGTKRVVRQTEAKLFPEKNFVHDLVFNYDGMAYEINASEYDSMKP
jgi:hypothetical protein